MIGLQCVVQLCCESFSDFSFYLFHHIIYIKIPATEFSKIDLNVLFLEGLNHKNCF